MNEKNLRRVRQAGFASSAVLAVFFTGCNRPPEVQYVAAPAAPAAATTVVQVQPAQIVQQDDYVYYPAYEVYYSSSRRDYRYREGSAWVTRAAPPHISVDLLFASPSVRMDFHDAPEHHHEAIFRNYPRNWSPPGRGREERNDRKDDHRDDRKEKR